MTAFYIYDFSKEKKTNHPRKCLNNTFYYQQQMKGKKTTQLILRQRNRVAQQTQGGVRLHSQAKRSSRPIVCDMNGESRRKAGAG